MVLSVEKGMLSIPVDSSQTLGPCTERAVKYIAKSAAKNINSLESQTMVPTATRLGRLAGAVPDSECSRVLVTRELWWIKC